MFYKEKEKIVKLLKNELVTVDSYPGLPDILALRPFVRPSAISQLRTALSSEIAAHFRPPLKGMTLIWTSCLTKALCSAVDGLIERWSGFKLCTVLSKPTLLWFLRASTIKKGVQNY